MKTSNALIGLTIVVALGVGFYLGRINTIQAPSVSVPKTTEPQTTSETTTISATTTVSEQTSSSETPAPVPTTTPTPNLSPTQIKMLTSLGIDPNKITPTMIACAETSLGPTRALEIKNGSSPSITEGLKIVACYK